MQELQANTSPFDSLRRTDGNREYWSARDLQTLLGYTEWRKFEDAIERAIMACKNSRHQADDHFVLAAKMVSLGSGSQREVKDYHSTRYGCYLIAMNGDPRKAEISAAQTYFAVKTREAEITGGQQQSLPTSHTLTYKGYAIRVTRDNGTPWVVARDVCQALGVPFGAKRKVPAEQRRCYDIDTAGGRQALLHIHEAAIALMLPKQGDKQTEFTNWLSVTLPTLNMLALIGHETPKGVQKALTPEQVDWRILRAILRYQAQNQKAPSEYEIHTRIWHSVPRGSLEARLPIFIIRGYVQVIASAKTIRYGIETRSALK